MHALDVSIAWRLRTDDADARPPTAVWCPPGDGLPPPDAPELRVLFPTTFSAGSRAAAGALAQLSRTCPLSVTVVHVTHLGAWSGAVGRALDTALSDLPDVGVADRRLAFGEDAAEIVGAMCRTQAYDLVMAPTSGAGLGAGLWRRSFRSRLLPRCDVPLWTAGGGLPAAAFASPLRRVACLVDLDSDAAPLLHTASAFARRLGATVHVLALVPPIDDGTLAQVLDSNAPLSVHEAASLLAPAAATEGCASIDVFRGGLRDLPHLLAGCRADLLFLGPRHAAAAVGGRWSRRVDRWPCPVICVPHAPAAVGIEGPGRAGTWASGLRWAQTATG